LASPFFFFWPPPKLERLRCGLESSDFHSQMACIPSGSPAWALQVGWIADQPPARHAAAPLQRGRDARLVSSLQTRKWSIFVFGDDSI